MAVNCWPKLAANFKENFEAFLQQEQFSDVTLIAKDMNGEDVKFPGLGSVRGHRAPVVYPISNESPPPPEY